MEYLVKYPDGFSAMDTEAEALQVVNNLLDHGGVGISDITVWKAERMKISVSLQPEN